VPSEGVRHSREDGFIPIFRGVRISQKDAKAHLEGERKSDVKHRDSVTISFWKGRKV